MLQDLDGEWRVAPAYDLPSSQPYGDTTMAMPIAGRVARDLGGSDFIQLGAAMGVPERAGGVCWSTWPSGSIAGSRISTSCRSMSPGFGSCAASSTIGDTGSCSSTANRLSPSWSPHDPVVHMIGQPRLRALLVTYIRLDHLIYTCLEVLRWRKPL